MNRRLVRDCYHVPICIRCTSRFHCHGPIVHSSSIIVTVSRSNRATSALTTVRLTHGRNTFIFNVYGSIKTSVPETARAKTCVRINPRVNITSAGTFAKRIAILTVLALTLTGRHKAVSRSRCMEVLRRLITVPSGVGRTLNAGRRVTKLTGVFACTRGYLCLKHKCDCPITLRNTLGLGRVSCVRTRNCPTTRVGRNPVTLVSSRVPIFIVTARGTLCRGIVDGVRRIGTHHNEIVTLIAGKSAGVHRLTSRIVRLPRALRYFRPLITSIPLRLLTCRVTMYGNGSISRPHGLTGSIAIRWGIYVVWWNVCVVGAVRRCVHRGRNHFLSR